MFGYFRIFAIISVIIMAVFIIASGMFYRDMAMSSAKTLIERHNHDIAEGYIESVWKKYTKITSILNDKSIEKNKVDPETEKLIQNFALDTINYFKKMPLLRVNIYNSSGALLLTSNINKDKIIIDTTSPDVQFLQNKFHSNIATHQIIENAKYKNANALILQTILPIITTEPKDNSPSEGVLEFISDLTPLQDDVMNNQIMRSVALLGLFFVFVFLYFIFSHFMVRRAEAIIAKQYEANVELAAAAAAAQSENRDKSQFLANVSHELRTPLNAIIGFSEIIKTNSAQNMDAQKIDGYVNDIHASGVHLLSLINDILDYSKAEAGKLEMEVAEVNLNKLVSNCIRLVTPRAEAAQVLLTEALPKETLNIVTDSKRFKQILLNLLSNSIKFTPAGGEVRVTAWANVNDDTYMFEVRDSGIGIAPKDISRAMSPFGQVDNTLSRKYDGTGLGLPLTKKFVELMGGKFEIESEVGVGTTVRFSVPREIKTSEELVVKNAS